MRVRLKRDSLEADIAPETGGGIAAFRAGGRDIFRCDGNEPSEAGDLGAFPMAPYVNRIARGTFLWRNETIVLPRNFGDHPHPLHGVGWRAAWTCERRGADAARLSLSHKADASWPWDVAMTQDIALTADGLVIALSLTNADVRPMPASIGLHPFFPAPGAVLRLSADAQVITTPDGIPTGLAQTADVEALADGVRVETLALDHCLVGWDGCADIIWPDRRVRIETDPPQSFVQVFTPPGADFFCVEPQSAMPDAVNRSRSGAVTLAAGEAMSFETRFLV